MLTRLLLSTLILGCASANAVRFRNAYVSFELPPNWNCKLEGSEWVCENNFSQKTKEAIIILTAKEVGPNDTLAQYMAHLQTPRTLQGKGGQQTKSQIISAQQRLIAKQPWIDALHLGSEVGPYFTRYLATIKDKIAILVTFSAHKEHYTKYSADFIRAVESLQIIASKDTLAGGGHTQPGPMPELGTRIQGGAPFGPDSGDGSGDALPEEGAGGGAGGKYFNYLIIALMLLAIGFYFYSKSKKPQPKKTKK